MSNKNKDAMNYIAKFEIFMINESLKNLELIEELRNAVINERKSRKLLITFVNNKFFTKTVQLNNFNF